MYGIAELLLQVSTLLPLPLQKVEVGGPFWGPRLETNASATLGACLHQCRITGRIRNFAVAAGLVLGKHEGYFFNDSDVYKVLEGGAYILARHPDSPYRKQMERVIDLVGAAQERDGYLNTFVQVVKPGGRWKNVRFGHELYCAGHLFEAGDAWFRATGEVKLLGVAERFARNIRSVFGPRGRHDPPGHEEIELALFKLWRLTGNRDYLDLARFFLEQRGRPGGHKLYGEYAQDTVPVRKLREVHGHAVRAMYLFCGMTDLYAVTGDPALKEALDSLWTDLTERKMYVTGGIGSSGGNEGFTGPYDLPNDAAYCESCAAVGLALWAERMFRTSGEARYLDVLERVLYNGLLSGVSWSGDKFFYRNPLGSRGDIHRKDWYACACCPPNLLRYIASLPQRIYARRGDRVYLALYAESSVEAPLDGGSVRIAQETRYPWDGRVKVHVDPAEGKQSFELLCRVPGWCGGKARFHLDGKPVHPPLVKGFASFRREWKRGDTLELEFPMEIRRVHADPRVAADRGRTALARGPLVYCLEACDNGGRARNLVLPPGAPLEARFEKGLFGGTVVIEGPAEAVLEKGGKRVLAATRLEAIPYSLWDNRAPGEMVVWIPEDPLLAETPGEKGIRTVFDGVVIRASHVFGGDRLTALRDGVLPRNSSDGTVPRFTWWPRKGSVQWVEYGFQELKRVSGTEVYWFDDGPSGGCRVPASWRLLYKKGGKWVPVELLPGEKYGTRRDGMVRVRFRPVSSRNFRLEVKLKKGFSGGILEWRLLGGKPV